MKLTARIKAHAPAPPAPKGHHHSHWHTALLAQLSPVNITSMETLLTTDGLMTVRVEYTLPPMLFKAGAPPPVKLKGA